MQNNTQNFHQRRQDKINVSISDILEYCKTPKSIKEILEFFAGLKVEQHL